MTGQPPAARSTFVTVLAWFSIVISAFGALIGVLQIVMVYTIFSMNELGAALEETLRSAEMGQLPWLALLAMTHLQWIFVLPLLLSLAMLIVSIGLLRRKNWARITFIVTQVLNCLGTLVVTIAMGAGPLFALVPLEGPGASEIRAMMLSMGLIVTVMNIAIVVLSAWLVWKLTRVPIKREFGLEVGQLD
jgi:hypothetical protein